MAYPPLATPGDLAGLPGAPFSEQAVTAAGEQLRRTCGWHISPEVEETLTVDSPGGRVLWLPTRWVLDVTAVRDVSGSSPVALSGWRWSQGGMLSLESGFPAGFRAIEVDLVHGFELCPADLLPVIADRTKRRVMQESLGSRSITFGVDGDRTIDQTLASYRLGPRS